MPTGCFSESSNGEGFPLPQTNLSSPFWAETRGPRNKPRSQNRPLLRAFAIHASSNPDSSRLKGTLSISPSRTSRSLLDQRRACPPEAASSSPDRRHRTPVRHREGLHPQMKPGLRGGRRITRATQALLLHSPHQGEKESQRPRGDAGWDRKDRAQAGPEPSLEAHI